MQREFRCFEATIEENERHAVAENQTQDTWFVQPVHTLLLSYDDQTTTSPHNALYVLHRWY